QPVLKADALDLEIAPEDFKLALERYLLSAGRVESQSQQLAQARNHPPRRLDILLHQRRDRVQGVEEKMRMELHLERDELRLGQLRVELCGARLGFAKTTVVEGGLDRHNRQQIDEQVVGQAAKEEPAVEIEDRRIV